jgi:hypothetical protein
VRVRLSDWLVIAVGQYRSNAVKYQVSGSRCRTVRWPEPITDRASGSDQRRHACWDRSGKGFQPVTVAAVEVAVRSTKETPERRERAHHWIARRGCAVVPRGYRSPIGLEGGSRSRVSDPRTVRLSDGRREYRNPASRPVDNGETPTRDPGCRTWHPGSLVLWRCNDS